MSYLTEENSNFCLVASNILILKTCNCQDILHCTCQESQKCQVVLSDFDSIKETECPRVARNIPSVECCRKTPEQMEKVMGTKAYRAPEVGGLVMVVKSKT